jgi:uncharacterized protein YndB with AHSA1/START domain
MAVALYARQSGGVLLMGRTDQASRVVRASPQAIYGSFVDPGALAKWLTPSGMTGRIERFEPVVGGGYGMSLTYLRPDHATPGKSSEHEDIVECEFLELTPAKRIVQRVTFQASDPAFQEPMTMTWQLEPVADGTRVTIFCENVPDAISREDHHAGLRSSLSNLAAFMVT